MKIYNYIVCILSLILLGSCASLTGLEEGRTLGESNSEVGLSGNLITSPDVFESDPDLEGDPYYVPMVEVVYKYGVLENLDLGARVNTTLNLGAFVKYQLVGDKTSNFALSTGLELSTFAGLAYAIHIPIYTSFHPSDMFSVYFNPKYVYQHGIVDMTNPVNYLGGNIGFLMGRRHKFGIDVGYYSIGSSESATSGRLINVGLGVRFRLGDNSLSDEKDSINEVETRKRKRR